MISIHKGRWNRELDHITIQQDKENELRWPLSMRQWVKVDRLRAATR
jgi:hypothetical protein